jgi:tetratricopeptide (TPR) repeat protein
MRAATIHQRAIASLERATALAKDFAPAYLALVGELRAVRQAAKAAIAAKSARDLAGSLRNEQRLRAEAMYRESRKEWSEAEKSWRRLLEASPDDVGVAQALAHSLLAAGDAEAMIEALRQIGFVLGEQGKVDEASAVYRDAIARAKQIGDHLAEGILLNDFG